MDLRPLRSASSVAFAAVVGLALTACDSGSDSSTFPGDPPGAGPVSVDFHLRRDVMLGGLHVSDALVLDLDGDGLSDLVEANFAERLVRIALGVASADPIGSDPTAGFAIAATLPTAGQAWRLAAGDVDGDGLTDVVVAVVDGEAQGVAGVTVFFQGPVGTFSEASAATLPLDSSPWDVALLPDPLGAGATIWLAEPDQARLSGVAWTGAALELVEVLGSDSLGLGRPFTVAALDVGDDGLADLVAGEVEVGAGGTGTQPDRVVLYRNTGGGPGAPEVVLSPAFGPVVDALGDLDGNGFEDLGVAQMDAGFATVVLADAAGELVHPAAVEFGGPTTSILSGDLDNQGALDLGATLLDSQEIVVRFSTGPIDPLVGLPLSEPLRLNVGPLPRAIGFVEATQDGLADLVCASHEDVAILRNVGAGDFRAARGYPIGASPILLRCADLDGDLDLDVVAIDHAQRQVDFLENVDGAGTFELVSEIPFDVPGETELPGGFQIVDVDGDGLRDVVVAIHELGEIHVLRNQGSVAFSGATEGDVYPVAPELLGVAVADFDEDGDLDVVTASEADGALYLLRGKDDAPGSLLAPEALPLPLRPAAVVAIDADGDGALDLAVNGVHEGGVLEGEDPPLGPVLAVLEGDGAGGFTLRTLLPTDTYGASLLCGDLDGDGLCELVVGQPAEAYDDVFVFRNLGGFQFEGGPIEVGGNPAAVELADVDLDPDGTLDLVVPTGVGELRMAAGLGDGTFGPLEPPAAGFLPVPYGTSFTCVADVTGDGLADLLMVSPKSPNLWVARNVSTPLAEM